MTRTALRVRGATFEELCSDLATVKRELERADAHAGILADAVGHAALADRVETFASAWDDRRRDLTERIRELAGLALELDAAFDRTEADIVRGLAGSAS